jgi:hypothetical protein
VAAAKGLTRLEVGVNLARHETYWVLHRDNEPGYNQPDVYLMDD